MEHTAADPLGALQLHLRFSKFATLDSCRAGQWRRSHRRVSGPLLGSRLPANRASPRRAVDRRRRKSLLIGSDRRSVGRHPTAADDADRKGPALGGERDGKSEQARAAASCAHPPPRTPPPPPPL